MKTKLLGQCFYLLSGIAMLSACASSTQATQTPTPMVDAAIPAAGPSLAVIPRDDFALWLDNFKREALQNGIPQPVLEDAFSAMYAPLPEVVQHDRTQPEQTQNFTRYMKGFITDKKLDAIREQWDSHAELLAQIQDAYGVPVPILLALWHTESRFGAHQGNFSIIQALATLAYEGRRGAFFRTQLMDALSILQQEHMDSSRLIGSWAGAMGQVQFMPSSYLAFAVDFDGDGKKDIWNSDADAVASMANYLKTKGWDNRMGWGSHVRVADNADMQSYVNSKEWHDNREWQQLGIRSANGRHLPNMLYKTRLVMPDGDTDNAYLVTSNYEVLMDWNHSIYFATGVGLLSDAIGGK